MVLIVVLASQGWRGFEVLEVVVMDGVEVDDST